MGFMGKWKKLRYGNVVAHSVRIPFKSYVWCACGECLEGIAGFDVVKFVSEAFTWSMDSDHV